MFVFPIIRHNGFVMEPFSDKMEGVLNDEVTIRILNLESLQLEWLPISCISTDCITQSHAPVRLMMLTECERHVVCLP